MKKLWIGIVIVLIVALAIVIFLTQIKEERGEINIGVITSLTGASAKYGQSALNGIQMAVDEINDQGGVKGKPIRLIIEDDGSESSRAVSAFRKLGTIDKVPVIIGPISSSAAMATSPVANQLHVVLFSPAAATPTFTSPNDYTFRNRVSSEFELSELGKVAYDRLNLRRIATLYVNNAWGSGASKAFEKSFKDRGGNILTTETFDEGDTDMRTQLTKIKKLDPDGVFIVGQGSEGGYALRQAFELGIKKQFLSALSIQRTDVLQIAGEAANGVVYAAPLYDPRISKSIEEFDRRYKQRYNMDSDLFSGNGYDAMYLIKEAINKGGYTPDGIRNALFNIKDYPGVTGNTTFDRNGDVIKPISIKKIQDGKFVYFDESNSKNYSTVR